MQLAIRNNPTHLRSISSRSRQGAALRSAYGALLPSVSSGFSASFREGGQEIVGGQQFGSSSDILSSAYSIGINAFYNGAVLMQPRGDRANLTAAEADVTSSAASTRAQVVTQYLNVLQAQARAALQDRAACQQSGAARPEQGARAGWRNDFARSAPVGSPGGYRARQRSSRATTRRSNSSGSSS